MSRLQELIDELCPDGVVFERFDSVCTLKARIGWQRLTKAERLPVGDYLLITGTDFQSNHKINYSTCEYVTKERYEQDENIQLCDGDVLITKDGTLGKVVIVESLPKPATLNSHLFVVRSKTARLEQRFIMHYLLSYGFTSAMEANSAGSTIKGFTQKAFSSIKIPVPPIEVQREIVRILDSFQEFDDALTAEIEAREKQFEKYRDELLEERLQKMCPDGVEYKTLSELFDIRNGYTPSKKNPSFWEDGTHPWFVMEDIRRDGTVLAESAAHITDEALKKDGLFPANSIIVATSATIGVHALITVDFLCNQRFACMTIKKKYADTLNIRYVHQAFFALDRWCLEHVDQGNFATVNSAALKAYRIPVPPIEVQREIVRILDSFQEHIEAMCSERDARRKQFEHYRDCVLTFPEKEV